MESSFENFLINFLKKYFYEEGKIIIERDYKEELFSGEKGFLSVGEEDEIWKNLENAASELASELLETLKENGFYSQRDLVDRREELQKILKQFIDKLEEWLKE